jgi:hypothetical protein
MLGSRGIWAKRFLPSVETIGSRDAPHLDHGGPCPDEGLSRAGDRGVLVAAVVPHNDGVNGGVADASAKRQGETTVDYYAGFDRAP